MTEMKRYRPGGYGAMVEAEDGPYVLWEDVEKLIAERDALKKKIEGLGEWVLTNPHYEAGSKTLQSPVK